MLTPKQLGKTAAIADMPTGGAITVTGTIEQYRALVLSQSTASQTVTLPTPSDATVVYGLDVANTGSTSVTVSGASIAADTTARFLWDGAAWLPAPAGFVPAERLHLTNTAIAPAVAGDPTITEIVTEVGTERDRLIYYTGDDLPASVPTHVWYVDHAGNITLLRSPAAGGVMTGASGTTDGVAGQAPQPTTGQQDLVLHGDGLWRQAIPNWTAGTTYSTGAVVFQNQRIYRRVAAGTSGLTFDGTESAKWTILADHGNADEFLSATDVAAADTALPTLAEITAAAGTADISDAIIYYTGTDVGTDDVTHVYHIDTNGAVQLLRGPTTDVNMTGASANAGGASGNVPTPTTRQQDLVLHGDATWRGIAPDWVASRAYSAQAVVVHNGALYRRIADGTSGATFDAAEASSWDVIATAGNARHHLTNTIVAPATAGRPTLAEIQTAVTAAGIESRLAYYTGTDTAADQPISVYDVDGAGTATLIGFTDSAISLDNTTYTRATNGAIEWVVDGNPAGGITWDTANGWPKLTFPGGIDPPYYSGDPKTIAQRNAMAGKVAGWLVYVKDTTVTPNVNEYQIWDGTKWVSIGGVGFDTFVTNTTYLAGDLVMVDGTLYTRTSANSGTASTASPATDTTNWTPINLGPATPATSTTAGTAGLMPAAAAGAQGLALHGNGNYESVAKAWAAATAVSAGELRTHNNRLYRAKTARTTGATWDGTEAGDWDLLGSPGFEVTSVVDGAALVAGVYSSAAPAVSVVENYTAPTPAVDSWYGIINTGQGTMAVGGFNLTGPGSVFFRSNPAGNAWVAISVTGSTNTPFVGATATAAGGTGLVPAPASGAEDLFLKADSTWAGVLEPWAPSTHYSAGVLMRRADGLWERNASGTSGATWDATEQGAWTLRASLLTDALRFRGGWDASTNAFPSGSTTGDFYRVTTAGTVNGIAFTVGDTIYAYAAAASTTTYANNWIRIGPTPITAMVGATGAAVGTGGTTPTPAAGQQGLPLHGDGNYKGVASNWVASTAVSNGELRVINGALYRSNSARTTTATANAAELTNWTLISATPATMTGATALANGTGGLTPQPNGGQQDLTLFGDATWRQLIPDWTASRAYSVGAIVANAGIIYRRISAGTSFATWTADAAQWTTLGGVNNRVHLTNTAVNPATPGWPTAAEITARAGTNRNTILYYTGDDTATSAPLVVAHVDASGSVTIIRDRSLFLGRYSTTERNAFTNLVGGEVIYNTTTDSLQWWWPGTDSVTYTGSSRPLGVVDYTVAGPARLAQVFAANPLDRTISGFSANLYMSGGSDTCTMRIVLGTPTAPATVLWSQTNIVPPDANIAGEPFTAFSFPAVTIPSTVPFFIEMVRLQSGTGFVTWRRTDDYIPDSGSMQTDGASNYTIAQSNRDLAMNITITVIGGIPGEWREVTPDVFTGSTFADHGTTGLVPRPLQEQDSLFLKADGGWARLAPDWAASTNYSGGAIAVADGNLQRRNLDGNSGATWAADRTNWTQIGGTADSIQTLNATGTVTAWGSLVLIGAANPTADMTITLPTADGAIGERITFVRVDNTAFRVTIAGNGAETVTLLSGASELGTQNGAVTVEAVTATASRQVAQVGSIGDTIQTLNATGTVTAWGSVVLVGATDLTANITITLPAALGRIGRQIRFIRLDNTDFTVTLAGAAGNTVTLAAAGTELNRQNGSLTLEAITGTTIRQVGQVYPAGVNTYTGWQVVTEGTPALAINTTAKAINFGATLRAGDIIQLRGNYTSTGPAEYSSTFVVQPGLSVLDEAYTATDHLITLTFPSPLTASAQISHGSGNGTYRVNGFTVSRNAANAYVIPTATTLVTPRTITATANGAPAQIDGAGFKTGWEGVGPFTATIAIPSTDFIQSAVISSGTGTVSIVDARSGLVAVTIPALAGADVAIAVTTAVRPGTWLVTTANAGVAVTVGNLKFQMAANGNRSFQVATVSGTLAIDGVTSYSAVSYRTNLTATTTFQYINSVWSFGGANDSQHWLARDASGTIWDVKMAVGASYANNLFMISTR